MGKKVLFYWIIKEALFPKVENFKEDDEANKHIAFKNENNKE